MFPHHCVSSTMPDARKALAVAEKWRMGGWVDGMHTHPCAHTLITYSFAAVGESAV